jgi:hypothetical protein
MRLSWEVMCSSAVEGVESARGRVRAWAGAAVELAGDLGDLVGEEALRLVSALVPGGLAQAAAAAATPPQGPGSARRRSVGPRSAGCGGPAAGPPAGAQAPQPRQGAGASSATGQAQQQQLQLQQGDRLRIQLLKYELVKRSGVPVGTTAAGATAGPAPAPACAPPSSLAAALAAAAAAVGGPEESGMGSPPPQPRAGDRRQPQPQRVSLLAQLASAVPAEGSDAPPAARSPPPGAHLPACRSRSPGACRFGSPRASTSGLPQLGMRPSSVGRSPLCPATRHLSLQGRAVVEEHVVEERGPDLFPSVADLLGCELAELLLLGPRAHEGAGHAGAAPPPRQQRVTWSGTPGSPLPPPPSPGRSGGDGAGQRGPAAVADGGAPVLAVAEATLEGLCGPAGPLPAYVPWALGQALSNRMSANGCGAIGGGGGGVPPILQPVPLRPQWQQLLVDEVRGEPRDGGVRQAAGPPSPTPGPAARPPATREAASVPLAEPAAAAASKAGGSGTGGAAAADAAATAPAAGQPGGSDSDDLCVICWENPRSKGFVHAGGLHQGYCAGCCAAVMARPHPRCPMCNQPVEAVLTVYSGH